MERLQALGNWGVGKTLHFFQTLNSNTLEARETLQTKGVEILQRYKTDENLPTGAEIQDLVLQVLAPIQTLQVVTGLSTVFFYFGRKVTPWPLSWLCTGGMAVSGFAFWDIWQLKKEVQLTRYYFERRGEEEITRNEFRVEADHLGDRMLASSDIFRVIVESSPTKEFRDIGALVNNMIETSDQAEELKDLLESVAGLTAFFKLNIPESRENEG